MRRRRSRAPGRIPTGSLRPSSSGRPLLEESEAAVWQRFSEQVLKARFTPYPASQNELLLSYARVHAKSALTPLFHLWAAENLRREARHGEAIALFKSLLRRFVGASFGGRAIAASALMQMALCHESLGDIDAATRIYSTLAEKFSKDVAPAWSYYRAAHLTEQAGRPSDAASLYKRAARAHDEPHQNSVPMPDLARRALARFERGKEGFFVRAEEASNMLTSLLRRKEGRSLATLASPTHFTIAAGAHSQFVEASRVLPTLISELKGSSLRIEPKSLKVHGSKAYLKTDGWQGEWFRGSVTFLMTRAPEGWEWSGVGFDIAPRELFPTAFGPTQNPNPIEITIKAPWPTGECFEAGGLAEYIANQAIIIGLVGACATGNLFACGAALVLTETLAAGRCGFGPRGFYYGVAPTHVGRDQFAIDFTRYRRGVPYDNVSGGTPVLAVAWGRVDGVVDSADTHDSTFANFVRVRHTAVDFIEGPLGRIPMIVDTPYVSEYFHLDGPGLIPVSIGMYVRQGARLGLMDDTGRSVLNHLHFSLHDDRVNAGDSVRPTPMDGHRLEDFDSATCVCSSNEPFPA